VPEPLLHPDLDNIPFACDCEARFDLISAALPRPDGLVIDVSPSWGYYLHRLEKLGFDAVAVPSDSAQRYFMDRLRAAAEKSFAIVSDVSGIAGRAQILLLLGSTERMLTSPLNRTTLTRLLMETDPRHVFVEESSRVADPGGDASMRPVSFCAAAMHSPSVSLLGSVGPRRFYHLSTSPSPSS
jgi:hypothetical protein